MHFIKNNILKFCGYTVVDVLSNIKWIFHNILANNTKGLSVNLRFFSCALKIVPLLVPVPDLPVIATWVHNTVPANPYVHLDDSFLFILLNSTGHSVWGCDTVSPKDIHKFLTDLTLTEGPIAYVLSTLITRPDVIAQSWKNKLRFSTRKP